jgi:3-oxoacyl-[acyl-carrier protein] reductase
MIDTGLTDKRALITGANHGIGAAIANALAAQGVSVFLHYFRPQKALPPETLSAVPGELLYKAKQSQTADHIARSIKDLGGKAVAWECDLGQPSNIFKLFEKAQEEFGPIDMLVNNAASWAADSFLPLEEQSEDRIGRALTTISEETVDLHFNVITRGAVLLMAEYARRRVSGEFKWGRIINVSTSGSYCFPEEVSYGAAKFAVESYSRSAAKELGRFGITVNVISPGAIQTGWISSDFEREIAAQTPLGRVGQPDDIADVVVFLCSQQARWVTGQLIHVGGGSTV